MRIALAAAVLTAGGASAAPARAAAASQDPAGGPPTSDERGADEPPAPLPPGVEERLTQLEEEIDRLREEGRRAQAARPRAAHLTLGEVRLRFLGYADVGFFKAAGDGVAYALDPGKRYHPEHRDAAPWVFYGDPWANPVNSQGDSADLGLDRTNIARWDPLRSGGRPTFLVNMVNLGMVASLGQELLFETSLNFEPRQGRLGSPGDHVEVDLAYLEWVPFAALDLHLFAGKFEPTFGLEYRQRKASDRYNVTPSLIARYTVGTQVGLKVRGSFFEKALNYNLAVTNGSPSTERFGHFGEELDSNAGKTLSARIGYRLPLRFHVELGASGAFGPQDLQPDDRVAQWQVGGDLKLVAGDFTLRAEYLQATAPGGGISSADTLSAEGYYVDGWYQVAPWFGVYARVDRRIALLRSLPNLYASDVGRLTGGVRLDINFHLFVKAEYLRIVNFGAAPDLNDDVFTTSAVFKF
jgi:hypothetical protein